MTSTPRGAVLITGATGLVGGGVLERMLALDPMLRVYVLVRDETAWRRYALSLGRDAARVTPVVGDLAAGCLSPGEAAMSELRASVTDVVHAAADTRFSQTLDEAWSTNTEGTRRMLCLARSLPRLRLFGLVSTAYVAGRRTGSIREADNGRSAGWVNAYERSKYEAEALVQNSGVPWVIFRPSTIVCCDASGRVTQLNGVHRALRIYHRGLAAMMPGARAWPVDVVTVAYVCDAIVHVMTSTDCERRILHLCAGRDALGLGELMDSAYDVWSADSAWRRRGIERAAITDLKTYQLFERAVQDTGDARLRAVISSLSHFVPQLALPKTFETEGADSLCGFLAPHPRTYWARMVEQLLVTNWSSVPGVAA